MRSLGLPREILEEARGHWSRISGRANRAAPLLAARTTRSGLAKRLGAPNLLGAPSELSHSEPTPLLSLQGTQELLEPLPAPKPVHNLALVI